MIARFRLPLVRGSEPELGPELADARSADRVRDDAKIDGILKVAVRIREVHGVENIEQIEPDLKAHPFIDLRVLGKAQIEPFLRRPAEGVASEVTETAQRGCETRRIDHVEIA